jgi:hypothetical protein
MNPQNDKTPPLSRAAAFVSANSGLGTWDFFYSVISPRPRRTAATYRRRTGRVGSCRGLSQVPVMTQAPPARISAISVAERARL